MSVQTADPQFTFHLPNLSYIDAKWEEPELRTPAAPPQAVRRVGLAAWLSDQIAAFTAWRRDSAAATQLSAMSDRQLMDIGVSRSDLYRAVRPAFNRYLTGRT